MKRIAGLILGLSLALVAQAVGAASIMDGFMDPSDGKFDISHWLAEKKGFFPMPIIITEPAVGYGAGAALVFLHDPLAGRMPEGETFDPRSRNARGKLIPPSISALFGLYTENDTWVAGGAHLGIWKNDNIRYTGAVALASVNMKFYGLRLADLALDFNLKTTILHQGLKFRLKGSNFFAGVNYLYLKTDNTFDISGTIPGDRPSVTQSTRDASLGLSLSYDNRDTIFTPGSGVDAAINASLFREAVGSDTAFEKYKAKLRYFTPIVESLVLGLRGEHDMVSGKVTNIPFYQYPFVYLRGIPVMRYQGKSVTVGEAELRWNVTPRWSLIGFVGTGRTTAISNGHADEVVYSRGAGIRYFIARRFGMHIGFDIAKGPEERAFYLQMGHAWR